MTASAPLGFAKHFGSQNEASPQHRTAKYITIINCTIRPAGSATCTCHYHFDYLRLYTCTATFFDKMAPGVSKSLRRTLLVIATFLLLSTMITMRTLFTRVHDEQYGQLLTRSVFSVDEPYYDKVKVADEEEEEEEDELEIALNAAQHPNKQIQDGPVYPTISSDHRELFPNTTSDFIAGMKFVPRQAFYEKFNVGYGLDRNTDGNRDVLLLYQSEHAMPSNPNHEANDIDSALEQCDTVQVVMVEPKPRKASSRKMQHKHCVAVMGQWESRHVHKFQKKMKGRQKTNEFEYTQHHHLPEPPSKEDRQSSQKALLSYLSVVDDALEKLKPIAEQASLGGTDGTTKGPIIVMVANSGQAAFFVNFVCSSLARGLDISRVLLFATDLEMYQLAQTMGVHVFYDERIFASIPKVAAHDYHDNVYGRIMMSKVYCVHMVNALGYDLLFQDLDLVWYSSPLDYFDSDKVDPNFDMYFQHDGKHHPLRFKPLAANTGVYFVRHNARTEYFFSVFVRMGELVLADRSHQAALTTLANEHMALWGLRVKVLAEDHLLFLSGYHKNTMDRALKHTIQGKHQPVLYHVNWMDGDMKQPALIESNNWYVSDQCGQLDHVESSAESAQDFRGQCCRAEPQPKDTAVYPTKKP